MPEKPELTLYNTLTREKEPFSPLEGDTVRLYSCGPTVYNFAHIGNLRTYVFMDLLRRVLRRDGYKLKHVMNITDVGHLVSDEDEGDDKMEKSAREQKKTPWQIAEEYTKAFFEDTAALNIDMPEIVPKATDHIPQMIAFVQGLVEKGYGYEIDDGIYFDVGKFKDYGRLSRADLEEQMAGARVEVNPQKRHPADFALWKKAPKEHIMQWPSPWGMGFPGWHIECSTMAREYLGDQFDIHTGGVDHIPVHHENEIAQSDALIGKQAVKRWMHGEFLMVDNGKMSKSLRNVYTVSDLKARGFDPLAFRYFCLNAHYRNKLNFTWDGLKAASVSYRRFLEGALAHRDAGAVEVPGDDIEKCKAEFDAALNDDLNVPKALGVAWQAIRQPVKSRAWYDLLVDMDGVLGLGVQASAEAAPEAEDAAQTALPEEVRRLADERAAARAAKNWKKSDELRDQINALGYAVMDSKDGMKIERVPN